MIRARVATARAGQSDAFCLENAHMRVLIVPELGGRVWTLEDLARNRQWIWHRPGVPLVPHRPGAIYDDVWAGGWEELFPNDAPASFEGRDLPDHGEWWATAFRGEPSVDDGGAAVRLTATARTVVRAEYEKQFSLGHDARELKVAYRIRSLEPEPFHFLFKQHLPIAITSACRLAVPGGRVQEVDAAFGTILRGRACPSWPGPSGGGVDLRVVPPRDDRTREFLYIRDLPSSWCGIDDLHHGASLRMHFDGRQLPFLWLFLSYGGWRDSYTAVLEPCTNLPKDLAEAVRLGQSGRLDPGAEFATEATVRVSALVSAAA
jgi:hypothetical protein